MADSLILPFNCSRYAETLGQYVLDLEDGYGDLMAENGINLGECTHVYVLSHIVYLSECWKFVLVYVY